MTERDQQPANTAAAPAAEQPQLRALVVDDEADINRLIAIRLKGRGFSVTSAANGEEAVELLPTVRPDVIVLDVSMPGMSGLDVLDIVRQRELDVAVIMATAFGSEQVAIEALRRGADDYLRKPFEPIEFRAVVERTVSRLQLQRQNAQLRQELDEKHRALEAELVRAADVQAGLLPAGSPELPGFDIAARCMPAREVGGDFYDWQELPNGSISITLGDVMGKGMPAALLMATVRAALRTISPTADAAEAVQAVDRVLSADLGRSGSFATLFHAQLDPAVRQLSYVDAGHGHAFLWTAAGAATPLVPRNLPIGLGFGDAYQPGVVTLGAGDTVVLYSDGLVDSGAGQSITQDDLAGALHGAGTAAEMLDRLIDRASPVQPLEDDLTLVVVRCLETG